MTSASKVGTSKRRHTAIMRETSFANKNVDIMISPGCKAFSVLSDKQIRAHFKYCQVKTHVQTARESHDLNVDLCSFDNGFE